MINNKNKKFKVGDLVRIKSSYLKGIFNNKIGIIIKIESKQPQPYSNIVLCGNKRDYFNHNELEKIEI